MNPTKTCKNGSERSGAPEWSTVPAPSMPLLSVP